MWQVHSKDTEVDLDDLSSGEKSVIQMFYPLLEHRIRGILTQVQTGQTQAERPEICVLIDEPELHLHPNLQVKVFDYLRILTTSGKTQVIVVSHSPTIVEHATFEELFL
jgi:predicted ATP-dependent endonuclease of OLD family